jgi:hypothetical protein
MHRRVVGPRPCACRRYYLCAVLPVCSTSTDLDEPTADAPQLVDERTSCTSHVYTASGKEEPTLWDCGSGANLVDVDKVDKMVPGDDYDELDVVPPDLVGLGDKQVSTARAMLLHLRCYPNGPLV